MRNFIKNNFILYFTSFWNMFIIYSLLLIIPIISVVFLSTLCDINLDILLSVIYIICIIFYLLFTRINKDINFTKFEYNKMNFFKLIFFMILLVFTKTAIVDILTVPINYLIETFFDFTILSNSGNITPEDINLLSFLHIVIIAPIFEEIIFRGFSLSFLKKFGNEFAIVLSAFTFGLIHLAFPQTLYAFISGLIYGYIAIKYGLKYSIIFHSFNNFMAYITYFWQTNLPPITFTICCYIALIITIFIFFKYYYNKIKHSDFLTPHYNIKQYLFCLCEPFTIITFAMFIALLFENV